MQQKKKRGRCVWHHLSEFEKSHAFRRGLFNDGWYRYTGLWMGPPLMCYLGKNVGENVNNYYCTATAKKEIIDTDLNGNVVDNYNKTYDIFFITSKPLESGYGKPVKVLDIQCKNLRISR